MKNVFVLLFLFGNSIIYAQDGLFIEPVVGAGLSSTSVHYSEFKFKDVPKFTFNPQLLLGYKYHNFIFKTGIGYLKTGSTGIVYEGFLSEISTIQYQYNNYLTIPLSVAYNFPISPRLSIVPGVSYSLGFLTSTESSVVIDYSASPASSYLSSDAFIMKRPASGTNSFAGIQVEADYKINSNFYISAGPEAQYKFSPTFPDNTDFFRPYTYTLNVGLKYCFAQKHAESITQSK